MSFFVSQSRKKGKNEKKQENTLDSPVSREMMIGDSASAALAAATAAVERDGEPAYCPEGSSALALLSDGK